MKRIIWLFTALMVIFLAASCNKNNEQNPSGDPTPEQSDDPKDSSDPKTSEDPEISEDPDVSEDPGLPLETLLVSLPQMDYTQDGDGIWRAKVTFTIVTETSEIYFVWGKDSDLDDVDIVNKYKPVMADKIGEDSWEYTIPELLPVFQTINAKVVAVKGDVRKSESISFDTFKSNEYDQTIYIEADECTAYAYDGGFSLTMVKDSYLFNTKTGGYQVYAKVAAPGNWDGNKKEYTIPDGTYELADENSLARFSAIIPGVGEYSINGPSSLEIKSNKMLGTWEIAFFFDAEYDDWNQFKRVREVVFTLSDKPITIENYASWEDAFPMTGNVDFQVDTPPEGAPQAAIMTRSFGFNKYKVLMWGANDTSSDSKYTDVLFVPLVLPLDFNPSKDSWSRLDGIYQTPADDFSVYSPFDAAVTTLNFLQMADESGVSFARYDREKFDAIYSDADLGDLLIARLSAMVQSAFPKASEQVAKLTASSDGAWLQLEVDFKDHATGFSVRCNTIIMTDRIVTSE